MRQALLFVVLGLLGGFAVSAWWSSARTDVVSRVAIAPADVPGVELARELTAQIDVLRREIAELRNDVARLEDAAAGELGVGPDDPSLARADGEVERFEPAPGAVPGDIEGPPGALPIAPRQRFRLRSGEGRIDALTEAGFALDRAQQIERRVEELRVAAMQARYEAARNGASANAPVGEFFDMSATLRSELGDADYERYLTAMGQPTQVDVFSVLSSSAAEQAGIEPGDRIVAYAGERVFDVRELNRAVLVGEPGEPVVVDIVRAGQPLQLVLPRGPIGISGGFARGQRGQ